MFYPAATHKARECSKIQTRAVRPPLAGLVLIKKAELFRGSFRCILGATSHKSSSRQKRTFLSIFVPRLLRLGGRQHIVEPFGGDLALQTIDELSDRPGEAQ